jgi:CMP-N,N'-diacetyllegionaminic acid synthase
VTEVLDQYSTLGKNFDNIMLLQPTSPLRTSYDITAAFALMSNQNANSIVSVCQADYPPTWYHTLSADGSITDFIPNEENKRRQDADIFYLINGAIYLTKVAYFLENRNIYRCSCFAYIMDKKRSVDIDDELDFLLAETILMNEGKR